MACKNLRGMRCLHIDNCDSVECLCKTCNKISCTLSNLEGKMFLDPAERILYHIESFIISTKTCSNYSDWVKDILPKNEK